MRTLKILLIACLLSFPFYSAIANKQLSRELVSLCQIEAKTENQKQSGLMLDVARHFYPVGVIKDFVDTLAESGGVFLHLHFSDDENYALESELLGQVADKAIQNAEGVFINPQNNKPFLSNAQIQDLVTYANQKGIELIPEVGSPAHMGGIFYLLEKKEGKKRVQALQAQNQELNMTSAESTKFVKQLLTEVIAKFNGNTKHIHLGGDEFGYGKDNNIEFVHYINNLSTFLKQKNLTTRIWNDGIIIPNLEHLNPDIEITYWDFDGSAQDEQTAHARRTLRASLPDLLNQGFKVLNYNSYYLYFIPKATDVSSDNVNFAIRDLLQNWQLTQWDGKDQKNMAPESNNLLGSAVSIWGEHAGNLSASTIKHYTEEFIKAVILKSNDHAELEHIVKDDFAHFLQTTYIDFSLIKEEKRITLAPNNQLIKLLNVVPETKKTLWLNGTGKQQLLLPAHWEKTDLEQENTEGTFLLYQYGELQLWLNKQIKVEQEES